VPFAECPCGSIGRWRERARFRPHFIADACAPRYGWTILQRERDMQRNRLRNPRRATAIAGIALALATAPVAAQHLRQPPPPLPPPPAPTQDEAPQIGQPDPAPVVPANPAQRPPTTAPIPSQGPARQVPSEPEKTEPASKPVLDSAGRPVRGMVQVAPNRVRDTATGRYYWLSPEGRLLPEADD
jgi:hypothetical protein